MYIPLSWFAAAQKSCVTSNMSSEFQTRLDTTQAVQPQILKVELLSLQMQKSRFSLEAALKKEMSSLYFY